MISKLYLVSVEGECSSVGGIFLSLPKAEGFVLFLPQQHHCPRPVEGIAPSRSGPPTAVDYAVPTSGADLLL